MTGIPLFAFSTREDLRMRLPRLTKRQARDNADRQYDPGAAAIDHIHKVLQIDAEWSVRTARGFSWWMGRFAQEVVSDPAAWSNDCLVSRLVARTTIALDVPQTPEVYQQIALLNALFMTMSSLVLRGDGTLQLVTTAITHQGIANWMPDHFALRVAMQAADAELKGDLAATSLGGRPAVSSHPTSGSRPHLDEMANVISHLVVPAGREHSPWQGGEMRTAMEWAQRSSLLAMGDDVGLTAEFAYRNFTSLLQLDARDEHPQVGNGLRATLRLPWRPFGASAAECAATLNIMESRGLSLLSSLHGTWCVSPTGDVAFNSFLPNIVHKSGMGANLVLWMAGKAQWVASLDDPRTHEERLAEAKPSIAHILDIDGEGER